IWFYLLKKLRQLKDTMREELESTGERVLQGPESASYRSGTLGYPRTGGIGVLVLTQRRGGFPESLRQSQHQPPRPPPPGLPSPTRGITLQTNEGAQLSPRLPTSSRDAWVAALQSK